MGILHLRHRYLIRQYVYPLMCILFVFLLIKWNMSPRIQPIGRQGHEFNQAREVVIIQRPSHSESIKMPIAPVEHLAASKTSAIESPVVDNQIVDNAVKLRPPQSSTKSLGNVVSLVVYMEAQCPDTSGFVHRNLVPTWKKLGHLNRLNVTIVPFGKAKCVPIDDADDFNCECQHGPSECDLNALMNCAIENKVHARDYILLIGCIQGQNDLNIAALQCLSNDSSKDWLLQCAKSRRGRYLMAMAGQRTEALGSQFDFVPWVVLDGERDIDSFYALEENVCKRLQPQPVECQTEVKNKINTF